MEITMRHLLELGCEDERQVEQTQDRTQFEIRGVKTSVLLTRWLVCTVKATVPSSRACHCLL